MSRRYLHVGIPIAIVFVSVTMVAASLSLVSGGRGVPRSLLGLAPPARSGPQDPCAIWCRASGPLPVRPAPSAPPTGPPGNGSSGSGGNSTSSGNSTSGGSGSPATLISVFSAHWNISYGGGGPAYLGPASQYLCSNCPVLTARWTTFTLNLSLTNHDVKNRSVYFTTTYIGCDPPFYLETTSPGDPFNIAPGATVVVSFTLWPDAATPGNRTFYGTIWTS